MLNPFANIVTLFIGTSFVPSFLNNFLSKLLADVIDTIPCMDMWKN